MADDGRCRFLPDDVIILILIFLPVKSLLRFKSVCKTWYNLFQNPSFISNHYNHSHNHNRILAVHSNRLTDDYTFTLLLNESLNESVLVQENIENPLISNGGLRDSYIRKILGPVNGIFFVLWKCSEEVDSVGLWNPSTTEFRKLDNPFSFCRFSWFLGFGSSDDDIKLVCLMENQVTSCVFLYSIARDCWKQIEIDKKLLEIVYRCNYDYNCFTSLNGVYYWLLSGRRFYIIVFDMKTEVFREVSLPVEYESDKWHINGIFVRDKCIVLLVTQSSSCDRIDIWEMKEEGRWNKILSFVPTFSYASAIRFRKNDELIARPCLLTYDEVFLYNITSRQQRNLGVKGNVGVFDYKESLSSVKGPYTDLMNHNVKNLITKIGKL